jgi:hypothetical protein
MNQTGNSPNKPELPCSPFFMCNSCHGFVIPELEIEMNEVGVKINATVSPVLNLHLSDYNSPAWQPPRTS